MEAAAAADVKGGGHHKQRSGFHLTGLDAQALPRLPLIEQLIAHRHPGRAVLAIKAVLALDHTGVAGLAHRLGRLNERIGNADVRHGRELNRRILPAGPLMADSAGGHHNISGLDLQIYAAAGADPDKCVRADGSQLLHGNGGGGASDARGADGDFLSQQRSGINCIFPVLAYQHRIVKQCRNGRTPARITGQNAVPTHIPLDAIDVKLFL